MDACRIAVATALLAMAAVPATAQSASLRVGIRIVEACQARIPVYVQHVARDPAVKCSPDTPHSIAWSHDPGGTDHPEPESLRARDSSYPSTRDGFKVATVTF